MTERFRLVGTQYANGSEEFIWTVIDMMYCLVLHSTLSREYAEYLCNTLNKGNQT